MQNRLSRILAGEIQQPGSFSVKTLKLVGDLDSAVLSLFQKLCSMAISLEHTAVGRRILDVRVLSLGGNAGANSLSPYGMSFSNLNILHEYGLVIPDFNSYFNYAASIAKQADKGLSVVLPFKFQGELKGLRWKDKEQEIPQQLRLHGVGLSTSGKELFSVMDLEAAPDYRIALTNFFNSTGYEILTVAI